MPKRPKALETVILSLEILRRIPPRRRVTARELHEQLREAGINRDIRTIQRQLDMLSDHFDLERDDRNRPYGYRWNENARGLAVPMLGEKESLLLALAEQHLRSLLPPGVTKSMASFFAQARANLNSVGSASQERAWLEKVRVVSETQPLLPPKIHPGVLDEVSTALFNDCWLDVDYRNAAGEEVKSSVMPLGLAQQGPRLYLVCRFRGYDDERNLAVNRILCAKASDLSFERPLGFTLAGHERKGNFGFSNGAMIRLSFRIERAAGVHLLESQLSKDQEVFDCGDHLEVSATVADTERLKWWLRGFGAEVKDIRRKPLASAGPPGPGAPPET